MDRTQKKHVMNPLKYDVSDEEDFTFKRRTQRVPVARTSQSPVGERMSFQAERNNGDGKIESSMRKALSSRAQSMDRTRSQTSPKRQQDSSGIEQLVEMIKVAMEPTFSAIARDNEMMAIGQAAIGRQIELLALENEKLSLGQAALARQLERVLAFLPTISSPHDQHHPKIEICKNGIDVDVSGGDIQDLQGKVSVGGLDAHHQTNKKSSGETPAEDTSQPPVSPRPVKVVTNLLENSTKDESDGDDSDDEGRFRAVNQFRLIDKDGSGALDLREVLLLPQAHRSTLFFESYFMFFFSDSCWCEDFGNDNERCKGALRQNEQGQLWRSSHRRLPHCVSPSQCTPAA
jgi:hypothetical protein